MNSLTSAPPNATTYFGAADTFLWSAGGAKGSGATGGGGGGGGEARVMGQHEQGVQFRLAWRTATQGSKLLCNQCDTKSEVAAVATNLNHMCCLESAY